MIWIPLADLQYPENWTEERDKIQDELDLCRTAGERSKLLRKQHVANVWRILRDTMADMSRCKCWYCETPITRDDLVVDHYRPKGGIYEEPPGTEGYWWLAVTPNNFRLSCKYCNERRVDQFGGTRGGKRTHFPLLPGSTRATAANRDLRQERPALLDPIRALDPPLLMFSQDAWARPGRQVADNPDDHERGRITIEVLHLNHARIRTVRGQICNSVEEAVERVDAFYRIYLDHKKADAASADTAAAYLAYETAFEFLAGFVRRTAPYAGAAKSLIRKYRDEPNRDWIEPILSL
jgi:5-methylcytosine-specific restriction endonuclease McrA